MRRKIKKKKNFSIKPKILFILIIIILLFASGFLYIFKFRENLPCANSISCIQDLSGKYDYSLNEGVFMGKKIKISPLANEISYRPVLGEKTQMNKHIYVDLSNQMLYAYENGKIVMSFLVSTGKWGQTPIGDFDIWAKVRYTRMTGGNRAWGTFYDLPNVPYVMFFYNDQINKNRGFSIHGTYWHNNFGHPMSHGCVNMRIEDAEKLYNWANPLVEGSSTYSNNNNPGTSITIYGTTPEE